MSEQKTIYPSGPWDRMEPANIDHAGVEITIWGGTRRDPKKHLPICCVPITPETQKEARAIARLIEAAPDMYEALKALYNYETKGFRMAQAALKKARGE